LKFKSRLDEQGTTTAEGIKVTAIPDSNRTGITWYLT